MTVFDHIIAGRLPASFVHQDEHCVAFMDIRPIRPGHALVVPRQSVSTLDELPACLRAHLFEVAAALGRAQRQALGSRAQHLLVNDGAAASQTVPHVHIHVIPRYSGDSVTTLSRMMWHLTTLRLPRRERPGQRAELEALAARIRAAIPQSFLPEASMAQGAVVSSL